MLWVLFSLLYAKLFSFCLIEALDLKRILDMLKRAYLSYGNALQRSLSVCDKYDHAYFAS